MKSKNYTQFIDQIYSSAKKASWKMFYDSESDSLFWTKKPIPSEDKLVKVAKEISFYMDSVGKINGLIIRPYKSNFVMHNDAVPEVKKIFTKKGDGEIFSIPSGNNKEKDHFYAVLSATIEKDIYKDVAEAKYTLKDLTQFLASTSKSK